MNRAAVECIRDSIDNNAFLQSIDALVESQRGIDPLLEDGLKGGEIGVPEGGAADEDIVAAAAGDLIRPGAADDDVTAGAALKQIAIAVANDEVVANTAVDVLDTDDTARHRSGNMQRQIHDDGADVGGVIECVHAAA